MQYLKLEHIFRPRPDTSEGLWAVRYPDSASNCFIGLFKQWENTEWMYNFCKQNIDEVEHSFGCSIIPADAAEIMMEEASILKKLLYDYATGGPLQEIFLPLKNHDGRLMELQLSKARLSREDLRGIDLRKARLRVYAIRIDALSYVVTGGAIKLKYLMSEAQNTRDELAKLNRVRDWLRDNEIIDRDGLTQ